MKIVSVLNLLICLFLLVGCAQNKPEEISNNPSPRAAVEVYLELANEGNWEELVQNYYGKNENPEEVEAVIKYLSGSNGSQRAIDAFTTVLNEDILVDESGRESIIKYGDNGFLKLTLGDDGIWRFTM